MRSHLSSSSCAFTLREAASALMVVQIGLMALYRHHQRQEAAANLQRARDFLSPKATATRQVRFNIFYANGVCIDQILFQRRLERLPLWYNVYPTHTYFALI